MRAPATFGHQPSHEDSMSIVVTDKETTPEGFVTIPFQDIHVHYDPEVYEEEEILTMLSECNDGDCSSLRAASTFDTPRTRGSKPVRAVARQGDRGQSAV
jgi:hypothetical protein